MSKAILYSFRRCPYAMRARMAIASSGLKVELREVVLANKPQALLDISVKSTVPVLITAEQIVIDESLDIMLWALRQSDPDGWLDTIDDTLIKNNDGTFKYWLDRYKYADRYPEHAQTFYREQGEKTLSMLEQRLIASKYLCGSNPSLPDIAIFPFIRQFTSVDPVWFELAPYPKTKQWLNEFLNSDLFALTMHKYPQWIISDHEQYIFPDSSDLGSEIN